MIEGFSGFLGFASDSVPAMVDFMDFSNVALRLKISLHVIHQLEQACFDISVNEFSSNEKKNRSLFQ